MRTRRVLIASTVIVGSLGVGLLGGTAVASIPAIYAPDGVSAADPELDTVPMPEPTYEANARGLTFGSAAGASSPHNEPDLIEAIATNGVKGYVYKKELDAANGTAAAQRFKTPSEALQWQLARGATSTMVAVFQSDGKTVVGEFTVTSGGGVVAER